MVRIEFDFKYLREVSIIYYKLYINIKLTISSLFTYSQNLLNFKTLAFEPDTFKISKEQIFKVRLEVLRSS